MLSVINLNLKLKIELLTICRNKTIFSIHKRFFSLAFKKNCIQANEILSYHYYESPEFQPKKKKAMFNTVKPVFLNRINDFGDLPSVLIKDSKWFFQWRDLISYWKKKKFIFLSRNLDNLSMIAKGPIDINKYLELSLGISYSLFWAMIGLRLGFNKNSYKWLWINADVKNKLDELKRVFKTTQILFSRTFNKYIILVRSAEFSLSEFYLYGLKCELIDDLLLEDTLTIYRKSKKKWIWLPTELTDFIYFVQNPNKRCVYYQHIGGVIKKIGKAKFDLFKKTLQVKVRKGVGFEVII